jgi:hypothetical protein
MVLKADNDAVPPSILGAFLESRDHPLEYLVKGVTCRYGPALKTLE